MADIVLKDRNGNSIEYPGVNRIKVKTTDGETRDFVDSETVPEVVENLPITLDFSGGNQEIIAPDGVVVKSATIQKPANLIPENIAEGVDIAGIIGSLAAGGGASVTFGAIKFATTGINTLEHNLGVLPDIFILYNFTNAGAMVKSLYGAIGFSDAFKSKIGAYYGVRGIGYTYSSNAYTSIAQPSINDSGFLTSPTSETIKVGSSAFPTVNNISYSWIAIGGLTDE